MSDNKIISTNSEELTFLDLVEKYIIEIPSIQRDYAQGRMNKEAIKIRENFTKELKRFLDSDSSNSLDFIYGSTDHDTASGSEKRCFIPLDGQQRLTTLFLLHIYLETAGEINSTRDFRFSYKTRDSSRRFCENLITHRSRIFDRETLNPKVEEKEESEKKGEINTGGADVTEKDEITVDKADVKEKEGKKAGKKYYRRKPSQIIKDEEWWFGSWEDDPTVAGMLVMLDRIDELFFQDAVKYAKKLFDGESKPITFQFLPMEKFYDTDDLYMKMNSRGLFLTPFEIFKSRLIEDADKAFKDKPDHLIKFKGDIDSRWIDVFWPIALKAGLKNVDNYFENILKIVISSEAAVHQHRLGRKLKNLDNLFEANEQEMDFSYGKYIEAEVTFDKGLLERIEKVMDLLCLPEHSPVSNIYQPNNANKKSTLADYLGPDASAFRNVSEQENNNPYWMIDSKKSKLTYRQRLLVHAVIHYVILFPNFSDAEMQEWLRLVGNLSKSRRINSSEEMVNALINVEDILDAFSRDVNSQSLTKLNDWVAGNRKFVDNNKFFPKFQWHEEVTKAQLRKNPWWRILISEAESNKYLDGQIAILLYLADIIPGITPFEDININSIPSTGKFNEVSKKMIPLFDKIYHHDSKIIDEHLLVRAILSKRNYFGFGNGLKNIMNRVFHRDYSWKRLFRIDENSNINALEALKKILPDLDPEDITASLGAVIKNADMKGRDFWEKVLVGKYGHKILSKSGQGFLYFDTSGNADPDVRVLSKTRTSSKHCELESYYLYLYLEDKSNFANSEPPHLVNYTQVSSSDEDCVLRVGNKKIRHWNGWKARHGNSWYIETVGEGSEKGVDTIDEVLAELGLSSGIESGGGAAEGEVQD